MEIIKSFNEVNNRTTKQVSTDYTIIDSDRNLEATGDGTITIPLLSSLTHWENVAIKNIGVDTITVNTTSGENLDGDTTYELKKGDCLIFAKASSIYIIKSTLKTKGITQDNEGNIIIEGNITFNGGIIYGPAFIVTLTGNTNNLVIPDILEKSLILLESTVNCNLTGIVPGSTTQSSRYIWKNRGGKNITFKVQSGDSLDGNKIDSSGNVNLQPKEALETVYNTIDEEHVIISKNI